MRNRPVEVKGGKQKGELAGNQAREDSDQDFRHDANDSPPGRKSRESLRHGLATGHPDLPARRVPPGSTAPTPLGERSQKFAGHR
jgi:hypothetical protein